MKAIWTPRAIARASEIAAYVAAERPEPARTWVDQLVARVALLAAHPRQGRRVPELDRPEIREILFGACRIIYRLDAKRVVVLTVRHGRRSRETAELEEAE